MDQLDDMDRTDARQLRDQGWGAHQALVACYRVHGPMLPPRSSEAAAIMFRKSQARSRQPGTAFQQLVGYYTQALPEPASTFWWQDKDLPAFVFQSAQGPQRGHGRLDRAGLATINGKLFIRHYVFVPFFSWV